MNRGIQTSLDATLAYAKQVFQEQLSYGLAHRIRKDFTSKAKAGPAFAAFHAVEYGNPPSSEDLDSAWSDVETALRHFFGVDEIWPMLESAQQRIAQRPLTFTIDGISARAVPDVILFADQTPLSIIDWKVSIWEARDYRLQLALYALALTRCDRQSGFPDSWSETKPSDIRLLEVQLLSGETRQHTISDRDIYAIEDYIVQTADHIRTVSAQPAFRDLCAEDFAPAQFPSVCRSCNFRKICWESGNGRTRNQSLFD